MPSTRTIIGLGEILWDVFPDGPRFGGAPANFACSSAGVAPRDTKVYIVSAVGKDALGQRAIESLEAYAVDTSYVARVDRPTGQVLVQLDEHGRASYEFTVDTAWDHLEWSFAEPSVEPQPAPGQPPRSDPGSDLEPLAARANLVCFGTLGQRSASSRLTIQRFVQTTPPACLRILDINLRPPYWTEETLVESLGLANVLKLNDAELAVLATMLGLVGSETEMLAQLMSRYPYEVVALTRGARGSLLRARSGELSDRPSDSTKVVDTVGAGDAFTAALGIGLLDGLSLDTINRWAGRVAAFVCSQAGATPRLPPELQPP